MKKSKLRNRNDWTRYLNSTQGSYSDWLARAGWVDPTVQGELETVEQAIPALAAIIASAYQPDWTADDTLEFVAEFLYTYVGEGEVDNRDVYDILVGLLLFHVMCAVAKVIDG